MAAFIALDMTSIRNILLFGKYSLSNKWKPEQRTQFIAQMDKLVPMLSQDQDVKLHDNKSATTPVSIIHNRLTHESSEQSENVIIVFPFRDRHAHYNKVMQTLTKNKRKNWNLTVYVIEQDDMDYFRRAWLINIGLKLAIERFGDDSCAVTHDVDMSPSPQIDYTWCKLPTQICSELSCFHNNVPYPASAGGVVQASLKHWKQINGMTNRAFGWGGEDDDLFYRLKANKYTPIRRPKRGYGRCTCLNDSNHTKRNISKVYHSSIKRQIDRLKGGSNEWKTDGLNSLQFEIRSQYIDKWGSNWLRVVAPKKQDMLKSIHNLTEIDGQNHAILDQSHIQNRVMQTGNTQVTRSDRIMQRGYDASPIVIESYRLVIFTIPKSACTVIKQLARRIAGKSDWHVGGDKIPHDPSLNGLTYLSSFNIAKATSIMTSPNWTRVIFVRDPHVRILSAYLDKAVKHDYVKRHCGRTPSTFSEFLELISKCKDPHWQSQRSFIDEKWWPFINFVGHVETAAHDMKLLLKGLGIWERYGKYNWGKKNESIFQQNHLQSRATSSTDNLLYYYTNYEWHKVTDLYSNDMEFKSLNYSMSALQNDGINELTPFGVIGILSAQGNTRLRETSRSTWINSIQGNIIIKFLLDRPSPETIYEESKYGDIIFLNSSTSGRAQKFGEKLARWLKYAHRQWPSVDFIAKMDDDVFLCPGIVPYLQSKVDPKVYMGWKHSPAASALWNGKITRKERMDEMFVVLGSQLVRRLALRQYCEPGQPCARGLIDTNYGGTSLGAWLESYDDITAIPMNDNVIHYRAYGGLNCSDWYLFHKVSSSQMKALYMATH
tara:strand:+ start:10077 stop:12563 length:2487 start_codon:yes stop_codon:yes gene_type:complete